MQSRTVLLAAAWMMLLAPSRVSEAFASQKSPATSDTEIIGQLNFDTPGMEKVKAAVQSGNIRAAELAYLDYRRHISQAKWLVSPSDEPAQPVASDDAEADLVIAHKIRPTSNGDSLPKLVDMGKDFNWTYNPVSPKEPGYTDEWTYCSVSRVPFWEILANAYWKTHDERYAAWV
jgi:hypothetical protein